MLINAYYYAPHNHSMLLEHLDHDLAHMAELGTHAVSLCVQEGHLRNWNLKRLERVVKRARVHGLAVYAIPNRWGGLVAGWCDGFDGWSVAHTDALLSGYPANQAHADPAHPATREHYEDMIRQLFDLIDVDGLIWDEPVPHIPEVIRFLDDMTAYAKSLRPGLVTGLFAASPALNFVEPCAATRHIDYLGSDGHVRSEDHRMHRMKTTIFEAHAAFYLTLKKAGKQTLFLLEAQRHRDEDLENYLENLDRAFSLPMDHLMYYYSAHELFDPDNERRFNEATWDAVKKMSQKG